MLTPLFSLAAIAAQPRLLLTSAGLSTPALAAAFRRMARDAQPAGLQGFAVTMLVTAAMAPSSRAPSSRSPGELRRRRWADARKKARLLEAELSALIDSHVDIDCLCCARDDSDRVRTSLQGASCVWVTGGNTFYLWHHMRSSGCADLVQQRVAEGVLYVGQSAGSIVAGESIETAFWKGWDDPDVVPGVEWSAETLDAMGLAPDHLFFPHYSPEFEPLVQRERVKLPPTTAVVALADAGPAYVVGDLASEASADSCASQK